MVTRSGSKSSGSTNSGATGNGSDAKANGSANGSGATSRRRASTRSSTTKKTATASDNGSPSTTKASAGSTGKAASTRRSTARAAAASAAGTTARARIASRAGRGKAKRTSETKRPTDTRRADMPLGEPTATVPADDSVMAASNARRALSPDMPRVAWLRTQLQQMEDRQRERLVKAAQLMAIAIIFIAFVLQNSESVNVTFLFFSLNITLIWIIFGCALLGGVAGYLIGRPDKSLRALLPHKEKPARTARTARS